MIILLTAKGEIAMDLSSLCTWGFNQYKDLLFGLALGLFFGWLYHRMLGQSALKKSYEVVLRSKDETIEALKALVYERLDSIKVEEKDKSYFKKLKGFFKKSI